ncbi:NnrU family protein [Rhizobium sp. RU36D]|uniref:NnrU family protein n=1 Tax=Rhizobium sp. RU36D TaxID=1907415 RepID=UPI0009D88100|nr:NnrU family protein [Rhizobium sp. RU36D]SMC73325.1 Uncharacterized membrane protein [Rhizobium sp. RU36D]
MTELLVSLAVFLLLHSLPAMPQARAVIIASVGRKTYLATYSAVSIIVMLWVLKAALSSDYIPLWDAAAWQAQVTLVSAPAGLFLVLAGLFSANPASVTLRGGQQWGAITAVTRHPVLWGFILWSLGHLAPNGDLRSLILFGGLGMFSVAGLVVLDRRARRRLGNGWSEVAATTSLVPFAAIFSGRSRPSVDTPMILALCITAAITGWLLTSGHATLFGADPLSAAGY